MDKQKLASKIWNAANKMRSKIEANEYKDYILGLIFYKYLSDQEVRFLKDNDFYDDDLPTLVEEDRETVEFLQKNIGYFIAYKDLFSTWLEPDSAFDVSNVRDALSAFSRLISKTHKKVFDKIFDTLQTGLSKLGSTAGEQTKAIMSLLQLIRTIPMDGKQDYDVLGFIYEYLISNFAANAGKKAGEFYTPHEVSLLMSELVANHLKGKSQIKIYDPTSGSGSLLINIGRSVAKYVRDEDNIKYYAQELKANTYNLTRMNLVMRGIKPDNIVTRNGDTLEEDWPSSEASDPNEIYEELHVDAVVSNPPYSQPWDPSDKAQDPRYASFGLAPKGKADYAFLLHDLYHIKKDGIMTIVLPHGVLFRGGEEGVIRKNLIERNAIDAIIGLPPNIFFGTGIPTIIMVLKQKRTEQDVLIVDASKGFMKEGKNNKLRASDIKKITDTVIARTSVPKFSRAVTREEIRANDYNLNIPRYVDSSESAESWDIYASMFGGIPKSELEAYAAYWTTFPSLKQALFTDDGSPYVQLAVQDVKPVIMANADVVAFESAYHAAFASLPALLRKRLVMGFATVDIGREESELGDDLFQRLSAFPLISRYDAYQLLDDQWVGIVNDLEILQSEGLDAVRKVDPLYVIKKEGRQEHEVQCGWTGRIAPFDLVQQLFLPAETQALRETEQLLSEIPARFDELLESLTEEQRESAITTDDKDAFVPKEVTKLLKSARTEKQPNEETRDLAAKLSEIQALINREKSLKAKIKKDAAELENKTKSTIEAFTDEQARTLLEHKWIRPLIRVLDEQPETLVDALVKRLQALSNKYRTTFCEVEAKITSAESELASMLDDLQGNEFDLKGLRGFKTLLGGK